MFKEDKKKKADKDVITMAETKPEIVEKNVSKLELIKEKSMEQSKLENAIDIINQAKSEMEDRAKTYDCDKGERSIAKTVKIFEALTGISLTEEHGWKFMACLKMARSETGETKHGDNYVDGAAYFALAGEAALKK
jgi:hypothetical protein